MGPVVDGVAAPPPATCAQVVDWMVSRRDASDMAVHAIRLSESREWLLDRGQIVHRTGGFFSIVGLRIDDYPDASGTTTPMIHQPEVGLLGFVTHGTGSQARILVQAKAEPGNVGLVQAAPTVQATRSNYLRRHGGQPTPLLGLFDGRTEVVTDSLQSEQGTRFLGKYNRNMLVHVAEAPEDLPDQLRWFPVRELLGALLLDSFVNTDARSVLACVPWSRLVPEPFGRWAGSSHVGSLLLASYRCDEPTGTATTARWLARLRAGRRLRARQLPVDALPGWRLEDAGLVHPGNPALSVRFARVRTTQREVECWDQPLLASPGEGTATLLCQVRGGVLRFLFVARQEPGFAEGRQLGPTRLAPPGAVGGLPTRSAAEAHLDDLAGHATPVLSIRQSDEGGRFWAAVTRYTIAQLESGTDVPTGPEAVWLTLRQVRVLIGRQGWFTNESRTLVSLLAAHL